MAQPLPFWMRMNPQQLNAYLGHLTRTLAAPPGPRVPLTPGPGGMHFNPQAQLQPGQIQDLRHNAAFMHFLQMSRAPVWWMQPRRQTTYHIPIPPMPHR